MYSVLCTSAYQRVNLLDPIERRSLFNRLYLRSFPVCQGIVYSWHFSKRDCFKKQKGFVSFSLAYALSSTQRKHIHDLLRVASCSATENRRRRNCRIIDRQKWILVRYHEKIRATSIKFLQSKTYLVPKHTEPYLESERNRPWLPETVLEAMCFTWFNHIFYMTVL